MDGVAYPSPLALRENVYNKCALSLPLGLPIAAQETRERMVSSANLSQQGDFNPIEVTGDLQTPEINLYRDINFSNADLKKEITEEKSYSSQDDRQRLSFPSDDLTMPTSPNFYTDVLRGERLSPNVEATMRNYKTETVCEEELDLFPHEPCTSDFLLDFDDMNMEFGMDSFVCNSNDVLSGTDERCLQNINNEINLGENNIVARAVDQSDNLDELMDFDVADFLMNMLPSDHDSGNISSDLSTIDQNCIDFNIGGAHSDVQTCQNLDSFGNLVDGQFSNILGDMDLSCANILEQAVGDRNSFNEEPSHSSRDMLIDSFINVESPPPFSGACYKHPELNVEGLREQSSRMSTPIQTFPKLVSDRGKTIKIILNNGSPVIISHPKVEREDNFERTISSNFHSKTNRNITVSRIRTNQNTVMEHFGTAQNITVQQCPANSYNLVENVPCNSQPQTSNSALRRRRKSSSTSSRSSSSFSRVAEDFGEITLESQEDFDEEASGESGLLSRTEYADLSPEEKYFRMRKQNNEASKKCRERKKLMIAKNIGELNSLEEENGRLNREYKGFLRKVQRMRQLIQYNQKNQMYR